jgi:hypothetical protein
MQRSNRFVRAKIASCSLEAGLCGQFRFPCGDNSIRAGDWPFRARQLPVRAGKNQSVRPLFDPCGKKAGLWAFLMISGGQNGDS